MLKTNAPIDTGHGSPLSGLVWRFTRLVIDVRGLKAVVTVEAFPDAAAATRAHETADRVPGRPTPGGSFAVKPLTSVTHSVSGGDFVALATALDGADPVGLSTAVYGWLKANVPEFAAAEDVPVELPA